jgi:serine/threonine protein kinase
MEYMYGGDLLSQISHDNQGLFKWQNRGCSIALDIARGLTYLHSHNVRDRYSPNDIVRNISEY